MITVNEYFEGKVKSLSLAANGGKETVGVMQAGEYEFNTALKEVVTIISGAMTIQQKDSEDWILYEKFDAFEVPANSSFKLKIHTDCAYLCQYIG